LGCNSLRARPETQQAKNASSEAEVWKVTPAELEAIRLETSTGWLTQMRHQFSKVLRI
jgi:hypothetical protein